MNNRHLTNTIRFLSALFFGISLLPAQAITIDEILNLHVKACGGLDNLRTLKSLQVETTSKVGGFEIKKSEFYSEPNLYRIDEKFGDIDTITVQANDEIWTKSTNGAVSRVTGDSAKLIHTSLLLFSYQYLTDAQTRSIIKMKENSETSDTVTLTLNPLNGLPVNLIINKNDGEIARIEFEIDGETTIIQYMDYRTINGIAFPYSAKTLDDSGEVKEVTSITSIQVNPNLIKDIFEKPKSEASFKWLNPAKRTELQLTKVKNQLYVPLKFNGVETMMLLDTGTDAIIIYKTLADKLNAKTAGEYDVKGGGGSVSGSLLTGLTLSNSDLELSNQLSTVIEDPAIGVLPFQPGGILGFDFFSHFVLDINYADSKAALSDSSEFSVPLSGKVFPMELDYGRPVISAKIDGIPLKVRLDTGSSGSVSVDNSYAIDNNLRLTYPSDEVIQSIGVGGIFHETKHYVNRFSIGGLTFRNARVTCAQENNGITNKTIQGNVGNLILSRFRIIFNYPAEQVIFIRNITKEVEN